MTSTTKKQDKNTSSDAESWYPLLMIGVTLGLLALQKQLSEIHPETLAWIKRVIIVSGLITTLTASVVYWAFFSRGAKRYRKLKKDREAIPDALKNPSLDSVYLGDDLDLEMPVYVPNGIRSRHVHVLGATGSGKTESVVLNLLGQDIDHGAPTVVLDAKGDHSFLEFLTAKKPSRLLVFDLSSSDSPCTYDPLAGGSPSEAAQRLFNSMIWSEAYYRSKARAVLFRLFEALSKDGKRPSFSELSDALVNANTLNAIIAPKEGSLPKLSEREFDELSGLRDQISLLGSGHLRTILSRIDGRPAIQLARDLVPGTVIYFRLQALLDADSAALLGRLIINDLASTAAARHLSKKGHLFTPIYLDEFGSLICPAFLELIAKSRSAGFALHFSHQSTSDLDGENASFLGRIMDNASTKIVLRTYDADSTDRMAKSFGLKSSIKVTETAELDTDDVEKTGLGTVREVETFRAPPTMMKSLPTGQGFAFVGHGEDSNGGGSSVFRLRFPRLREPKPSTFQPSQLQPSQGETT